MARALGYYCCELLLVLAVTGGFANYFWLVLPFLPAPSGLGTFCALLLLGLVIIILGALLLAAVFFALLLLFYLALYCSCRDFAISVLGDAALETTSLQNGATFTCHASAKEVLLV